MRFLALDIGEKRIGVAVSDPAGIVATPVTVLDAEEVERDPCALRELAEERDVQVVVIGLPVTLAGEEGPQAARVRAAAERIGAELGLPIEWWDERLSTATARRALAEGGVSARKSRGDVDRLAAAVFLQAFLDRRATAAPKEDRDA
ncbi:MAG: Holliday junction resolvase RuvX [Anaerosomatales bacterium]|nr:Holliday junction resolvase RuvX [Anaerosomatales bacterium]